MQARAATRDRRDRAGAWNAHQSRCWCAGSARAKVLGGFRGGRQVRERHTVGAPPRTQPRRLLKENLNLHASYLRANRSKPIRGQSPADMPCSSGATPRTHHRLTTDLGARIQQVRTLTTDTTGLGGQRTANARARVRAIGKFQAKVCGACGQALRRPKPRRPSNRSQ